MVGADFGLNEQERRGVFYIIAAVSYDIGIGGQYHATIPTNSGKILSVRSLSERLGVGVTALKLKLFKQCKTKMEDMMIFNTDLSRITETRSTSAYSRYRT